MHLQRNKNKINLKFFKNGLKTNHVIIRISNFSSRKLWNQTKRRKPKSTEITSHYRECQKLESCREFQRTFKQCQPSSDKSQQNNKNQLLKTHQIHQNLRESKLTEAKKKQITVTDYSDHYKPTKKPFQ